MPRKSQIAKGPAEKVKSVTARGRAYEAGAENHRAPQQKSKHKKAASWVLQGQAFEDSNQLKEAVECYCEAISVAPDFGPAHHCLGKILLQLAQYDAAIESFQRDIQLRPDYSESYYYLRESLDLQNKLAEARRNYEKAVNLSKNTAEIYYYKGVLLAQQRKFAEAKQSYLQAIELDPRQSRIHSELGNVLARQGMYDQAIDCYRRAITLAPDFTLAYSQTAHVLALQDKMPEAVRYDKRALELTSQPPLKECPYPTEIKETLVQCSDPTRPFEQRDEPAEQSALPIIVFFRELQMDSTLSAFLPYCLAQAKRHNPRSEIILFSDSSHHYDFARHEYIIDYFAGAEEFGKVYKHIVREVRLDYLLLCFQRWFIVRDFMAANGLNRCLHIDPDVMLFTDVTRAGRRFRQFDFALSAHPDFGVCGHYNFINNLASIERYCDFLYDLYAHPPARLAKLSPMKKAIWVTEQGYITDMFAFQEFREQRLGRIRNLSEVSDDSVWDADVSQSMGFEMHRGLKNIYWREGQAFCKQLETGKEIRFDALHFCARAKRHMRNAFLMRDLWLDD